MREQDPSRNSRNLISTSCRVARLPHTAARRSRARQVSGRLKVIPDLSGSSSCPSCSSWFMLLGAAGPLQSARSCAAGSSPRHSPPPAWRLPGRRGRRRPSCGARSKSSARRTACRTSAPRTCARAGTRSRGSCPRTTDRAPACGWSARAASCRGSRAARALDADFENLRARARAIETYHLLDPETRDIYDGFAAGINRYVELHPDEFPPGMPTDFTGYDVATLHIGDGAAGRQGAPVPGRADTGADAACERDAIAARSRQTTRRRSPTTMGRMRGRSRRAARSPARRSCCAIRTWPGRPATTKRT